MKVPNRTIFCLDNLPVLEKISTHTVDLIYLDPPFNTKKIFTAPIGSSAEGASFKDIYTEDDIKDYWLYDLKERGFSAVTLLIASVRDIDAITIRDQKRAQYNYCYLTYMAIRLVECHRILKETGSIYLHCDPTMSHYLKLLMDCIFGEKNFRNEIVWHYTKMGNPKYSFRKNTDHLLFYSKTNKLIFNEIALGTPSIFYERHKKIVKNNKIYYADIKHTPDTLVHSKIKVFEKTHRGNTHIDNLPVFDFDHPKDQVKADNLWKIPPLNNLTKERTGYPTQKPLALLERIIQASSNEGDVVLDPFCGCATACVAAEKLHRNWIGIDVSVKAYELVQTRLKDEVYAEGLLKSSDGTLPPVYFKTHPPTRTDVEGIPEVHKYVYIITNSTWAQENIYKIGIASDVTKRLESYQTADADRSFTCIDSVYTPYYIELEKHLHTKFKYKGEWVQGDIVAIKHELHEYTPPQDYVVV